MMSMEQADAICYANELWEAELWWDSHTDDDEEDEEEEDGRRDN